MCQSWGECVSVLQTELVGLYLNENRMGLYISRIAETCKSINSLAGWLERISIKGRDIKAREVRVQYTQLRIHVGNFQEIFYLLAFIELCFFFLFLNGKIYSNFHKIYFYKQQLKLVIEDCMKINSVLRNENSPSFASNNCLEIKH